MNTGDGSRLAEVGPKGLSMLAGADADYRASRFVADAGKGPATHTSGVGVVAGPRSGRQADNDRSPSGGWGRGAPSNGQAVARNVEELGKVEERLAEEPSISQSIAERITGLSGSMLFVWFHVVWFGAWIVINVIWPFDGFPFSLLTMIVSLEAIFLSTFVLISQNRQARLADERAKIELQVNVLAEQEITKLMKLVVAMHEHVAGSPHQDDEVDEMLEETRLTDIADAVRDGESKGEDNAG